ncbi:MAG: [FeFe] hydrogenase H-cluster radical SAM maturase HydE [Fibromonadaceae bacterium]|jgi:biotin synthase|nr:[FeFe] hydrogenase H-cluster radical SAM maturase HydE [Fibromonadaceae bacterium]
MNNVDRLRKNGTLTRGEFKALLTDKQGEYLFAQAREVTEQNFGNKIYTRGLIEFSNYCKQNCLYCGLRCDNKKLERYRLNKEEILQCCAEGHDVDTFVLQSGEDDFYTTEKMVDIIKAIRQRFPDYTVTLSLGEKDASAYQAYYDAGARRFLLRHETIDSGHYRKLHAGKREIATRIECLRQLKRIGFQTGSGIMVGSPWQTLDNIIDDIYFLGIFKPDMLGIGPYLVSRDTPFANRENGSLELTLRLLAIFRLMHPRVLMPATTALIFIHPQGREMGFLAGANVVMHSLTPSHVREKYRLYDK